ncbi:tyrosinase-like [Bufo gargarizans]|uniref:tyrosinase-like n=1 Tax=Bufo gargarizans TaxID=30331 RepID=UPI001CF152B5|nr:tyrosinase-like [Bufo gargarizans]
MFTLCTFFALFLGAVYCQFPRLCTTSAALQTKTCCPLWKDQSPCGSRSGRGQCREGVVFTHLGARRVRDFYDDRLDWPRFYYDRTCQCFRNYSGFNCGQCKYGYYGDKCDRKKKCVFRREIRQLSFLERKRFFSYLALAKTTKSDDFVILSTGDRHLRDTYHFVNASIYDVFAWIHYYSMKPILLNGTFDFSRSYAHQGPAFPGWHRLGLVFIEGEIRRLTGDEDFTIPYYDWRGENNCSICTNEFLGASNAQGFLDDDSHFAFWKSICSGYNYADAYCQTAGDQCQMERLHRKPGSDPHIKNLPTFQDVEDTLKWTDFDTFPYDASAERSFRNALEGFLRPSDGITLEHTMHNAVHLYFGGTMSQVPISANDPIFLLHHCFIDKIFQAWLQIYKATSADYPETDELGQGPDECSTPYFPCYRNKDFLSSSTELGYMYSEYQGM